jgi:hypothetical protein
MKKLTTPLSNFIKKRKREREREREREKGKVISLSRQEEKTIL